MKTILATLAVAALALAACGDSDNNGASGVDKNKLLADYTTADATKMCDWGAGQLGGFGKPACDGKLAMLDGITASQAACVGFVTTGILPTCTLKTSDLETCLKTACTNMQPCLGLAGCVNMGGTDGGTDGSTD